MATALTTAEPTEGGPNTSSSFVGNTPSTVLFFLAMSVGVAIAFVFVFFTMRYFVRSRYGLHIYPVAHHGMMFTANVGPDRVDLSHSPSDRELDWYLNYLRNNHFFRDDFFERRYLSAVEGLDAMAASRRRRRRRRGRYSKMKKLTVAQVDRLFPKTSYAEWLHAGDTEDDITSVRMDADGEPEKVAATTLESEQGDFEVIELRRLSSASPVEPAHPDIDATSLAATSNAKGELHFDSGSCAICLETYEHDDVVRGLICGHVFHAECVDPWLTRRRACCPICKRDYYKENSRNTAHNNITELPPAETDQVARRGSSTGQEPTEVGASDEHRLEDPSQPQEVDLAETPTTTNNQDNETTTNNSHLDDDFAINYDLLRNDPNLRALLNELIPLSERANAILLGQETLDLESAARNTANKKYLRCWKRVFWRLMGISKEDMFNWAVISLYSREQAQQAEEGRDDVTEDFRVQHLPHVDSRAQQETAPEEPQMEQVNSVLAPEATTDVTPRRSSLESGPSIYHNADEDNANAEDLAEATREVVERRV